MADVFKTNLEKFLMDLIVKIGDQSHIPEIQSNYDVLMDEFLKYNFIPKEEIDSLIETELDSSEKEISSLKQSNEEITKQNDNLNSQIMLLYSQNEGLNQKIDILQKSIEEASKAKNDKVKVELDLANSKTDYEILKSKYNSLKDEVDIYKKNMKKTFNMEKEIKSLTEENEKLSFEIKNLSIKNDYKSKAEILEKNVKNLQLEKENFIREIEELKQKNIEIGSQRDKLNQSVSSLANEIKIKNFKFEEKQKEISNLETQIVSLNNKIQEIEYTAKMSKMVIDNQNKELKKEIEKMHKTNEKLQKDNIDLATEVKNYQNYTNYAKASKECLSKKDFSILETMSRKIEETQNLNNDLKRIVTELNDEKTNLQNKLEKLEYLNLYFMKINNEIPDNFVVNEKDPNYQEILQYKLNPKMLMNIIFKVKEENVKLSQSIQNITVECNTRLREALNMHKQQKEQEKINGMPQK